MKTLTLTPSAQQTSMFHEVAEGSFTAIIIAQAEVDCPRMDTTQWGRQLQAVYDAMKHGRWMTKAEISFHSGVTEHAVSARLSDLKKHGVFKEKRKAKEGGLYEYRLVTTCHA